MSSKCVRSISRMSNFIEGIFAGAGPKRQSLNKLESIPTTSCPCCCKNGTRTEPIYPPCPVTKILIMSPFEPAHLNVELLRLHELVHAVDTIPLSFQAHHASRLAVPTQISRA